LKTPLLFVIGFLLLFTVGGLSGVVGKFRLDVAFHEHTMCSTFSLRFIMGAVLELSRLLYWFCI